MSNQLGQLGIVLVNLGTPDGEPVKGPTAEQVKVYLKQFLMDRFVIDIPYVFRWMLVKAILRKRPAQSAEAYRKIWTERGSPLLHFHLELTDRVREILSRESGIDPARILPAMRYGKPSIPEALEKLKAQGVTRVFVAPLYPQYSLAATESSLEECREWIRKNAPGMRLESLPAFYDAPEFIEAFSEVTREALQDFGYDHLLFSFHGLPERHVRKTDRSGGAHCLQNAGCCERVVDSNRDCYRAQCYATAQALAKSLGLSQDRYTVCFQSRLGRTPWIRPYTDVVYEELASRGVKKVAVICPAFVADCLETLEEIRIRGREQFQALGGEELRLVPSLNGSPSWAMGLSRMIGDRLKKSVTAPMEVL